MNTVIHRIAYALERIADAMEKSGSEIDRLLENNEKVLAADREQKEASTLETSKFTVMQERRH